jgi:hypothetical protein
MRTSQEVGRVWIRWVKAFLEAKKEKRAGSLIPLKEVRQLELFKGEWK